jgi:uncharacterized protein YndB with AHSA1/START domain
MAALPHALDRTVTIRALRETVFSFLADSPRFARWFGAGSAIDARPGGKLEIRFPGGVAGEVTAVVPGERIEFTYGYVTGKPMAAGASRVTIRLRDVAVGTCLELRHEFAQAELRDMHVAGWRYQLAVLANQVCAEQHADLAARADRFFAAWAETDASARRAHLAAAVTEDVEFRDAYGCIRGVDDLSKHIIAVQLHMPGSRPVRSGEPRQCQGSALIDWNALDRDGQVWATGTNAVELAPDGRLASVVGFWKLPAVS